MARLGPAACAVHCLATPLVVSFAPWLAPARGTELGLAVLALGVSAWIVAGDVRIHGRRRFWLFLGAAGAGWLASLAWAPAALEPVLAPLCGLGSASVLLASSRLRRAVAGSCGCPLPGSAGVEPRAAA